MAFQLFTSVGGTLAGNRPNTVSESTVSNTELSELLLFFSLLVVYQSELTEFFLQNSPSLLQNSVRLSEFSSPKHYSRNSFPSGDTQSRRKRNLTHERPHQWPHECVHERPHESSHESPHESTHEHETSRRCPRKGP